MDYGTFLSSVDVTSLFTNIPQIEGIKIICKAYENLYNPPIPRHYLQEMLRKKILSNSMESTTYKPTVPRWAQRQQFSFANIFIAYIKTTSLSQLFGNSTSLVDDIFSLWDILQTRHRSFLRTSKLTLLYYKKIKFATESHWDNVFGHSCIQRHKIQRKSYPSCKDTF